MTSMRIAILIVLIGAGVVCPGVLALLNPAAVYCTSLNNTYTVTTVPGGGQSGTCVLPDKNAVDAWEFLEGRVAQQYSYCGLNNYSVHTVTDADLCAGIHSTRCALCVLPDGKEREVTALMDLTFKEPNLVIETASCTGNTCSGNPPAVSTQSTNSIPVRTVTILCAIGAAAGVIAWMRRK
jgi:putative hemolysin